MKKIAGILLLTALFCGHAMAQENSMFKPNLSKLKPRKPDRAKFELGAGYTYRSFLEPSPHPPNLSNRLNVNGFNVHGEYRIFRWLSAAGEISGAYNISSINGNTQMYTLMFGPELYPLGHRHKITPFGHVLFGEGFSVYNLASQGGFAAVSHWDNGYMWMAGGGLDVPFKKRWTIRLIDANYEITHFANVGTGSYDGTSQGNYRVSVGVIYRFGVK
ncbi:MAG: hypothetical protein WCE26_02660 [Candidatus Acidiferrales bacterium]